MTQARYGVLVLAAALSACASSGTRRAPPPPTTVAAGVALNTSGPWTVVASSKAEQVAITADAIVVISSDTVVQTDTVRATLAASYTWTGSTPRRVDGQVTDFRVAIGTSAPGVPSGLRLPRPFSATATAATTSLAFVLPAEATACTDPALSSVQGLQDAWVAIPATLSIGQQWTDTVHTLSCRDRVPLRATSVRRFVVRRTEIENGQRVLVVIERSAHGRLTGEGDQFGEKVAITGESSGSMVYLLDPAAGHFVRASGTSALSFSLKSSRRNQNIKQTSVLSLAW